MTNFSNEKSQHKPDFTKITYYNYNKKCQYANSCLEPLKQKKLILILATSVSTINADKKALKLILDWVSYIHYPVQFRKNNKASF